jgi:hypothetical protein
LQEREAEVRDALASVVVAWCAVGVLGWRLLPGQPRALLGGQPIIGGVTVLMGAPGPMRRFMRGIAKGRELGPVRVVVAVGGQVADRSQLPRQHEHAQQDGTGDSAYRLDEPLMVRHRRAP